MIEKWQTVLEQVQWLFIVLINNWHHEDAAKWSVDLGQVLWLLVSQFVALSLTECVWLYRLARFEIAGCEHPRRRATVRCPSPASNMPIARRRCSLDRRGILFFFCDFLYCFYSSLQFNSWNHSISSVQSTVSLIRWLSAYASVTVTQACHGQGWMIEWVKRN